MADDTKINGHIKKGLTKAATRQNSTRLDINLNLKESTENKDGTESTPSSAHSQGETSNRASPDPACSICLGNLQNKSFTDSCYHAFCFTCLLEWSKVKAVCPLCKVEFKSIVHNVRSNNDYDQYYVERATAHTSWPSTDSLGFHYTTTMPSRPREYHMSVSFFQYEQHRHTYAPHSVRLRPRSPVNHEQNQQEPRNIQFRRRVYTENLWAKRNTTRTRIATPSFYQANQACTHRLIPWLTRELTALMSNNEQRVGFVLDFMMSLILRYSILSEEFLLYIQPYFGDMTSHFVHEFYSYATSIYDIDRYDELMQYETQREYSSLISTETDVIDIRSDNSDEEYPSIDISMSPSMLSPHILPFPAHRSRLEKYKKNQEKPLAKLFLKKNRDSNSWNVLFPPPLSPVSSPSSLPEDLSLPSSSRTFIDPPASTSRVVSVISRSTPPVVILSSGEEEDEYVDVGDEECVILQELKPRSLRTPEVLELSSDPENALPELEPVSDGSFDTIEDDAENNPIFPDNSSPIVINVPDSSQTPLLDESPYVDRECFIDYIESGPERKVPQEPKQPEKNLYSIQLAPDGELGWSSSSSSRSRSRGKNTRSWSQERDNYIRKFFNKKRLLHDGRFSGTSVFGESSQSVRMPGTNTLLDRDNQFSSSSSPDVNNMELRSVVKKSSHHCPSDSSNNSSAIKKHKSKKRKRKRSGKHKHRKH